MPGCVFWGACLPNVYQKRRGALGNQGLPALLFSGCLPDVYQRNFFLQKGAVFLKINPFLQLFSLCKGRYTSLGGWYAFFSPLTAGFFPVFGILIRQKTRLRPVEGPRQSTGAAPSTQAKKYSTRLFFRRLARAVFRPLLCFGISSGPAAPRPVFLKAGQKSKRRNIR